MTQIIAQELIRGFSDDIDTAVTRRRTVWYRKREVVAYRKRKSEVQH